MYKVKATIYYAVQLKIRNYQRLINSKKKWTLSYKNIKNILLFLYWKTRITRNLVFFDFHKIEKTQERNCSKWCQYWKKFTRISMMTSCSTQLIFFIFFLFFVYMNDISFCNLIKRFPMYTVYIAKKHT